MTLISVKYLGQVEDDGEEDDWHDVLEEPTKARVLVIHRLQMQTNYRATLHMYAQQCDFSPYEEEEFVNSVDLVLVAKSTRRGCQL